MSDPGVHIFMYWAVSETLISPKMMPSLVTGIRLTVAPQPQENPSCEGSSCIHTWTCRNDVYFPPCHLLLQWQGRNGVSNLSNNMWYVIFILSLLPDACCYCVSLSHLNQSLCQAKRKICFTIGIYLPILFWFLLLYFNYEWRRNCKYTGEMFIKPWSSSWIQGSLVGRVLESKTPFHVLSSG